jgi:hypothetical protein
VSIQGNLLYQNPVTKKTLAAQSNGGVEADSIRECLAVSSDWDDIIAQIEDHRFPVCRIAIYLTGGCFINIIGLIFIRSLPCVFVGQENSKAG